MWKNLQKSRLFEEKKLALILCSSLCHFMWSWSQLGSSLCSLWLLPCLTADDCSFLGHSWEFMFSRVHVFHRLMVGKNKPKTKTSGVKSCLQNNRIFHNKRQCQLKSKLRTILCRDITYDSVQGWGRAQWYNTCLASLRPWVDTSSPPSTANGMSTWDSVSFESSTCWSFEQRP